MKYNLTCRVAENQYWGMARAVSCNAERHMTKIKNYVRVYISKYSASLVAWTHEVSWLVEHQWKGPFEISPPPPPHTSSSFVRFFLSVLSSRSLSYSPLFTCLLISFFILSSSHFSSFNHLAPELFFLILAHLVYKMWIIQEPNKLKLWNKLHFEGKKTGDYTPCLKYSVPVFVE